MLFSQCDSATVRCETECNRFSDDPWTRAGCRCHCCTGQFWTVWHWWLGKGNGGSYGFALGRKIGEWESIARHSVKLNVIQSLGFLIRKLTSLCNIFLVQCIQCSSFSHQFSNSLYFVSCFSKKWYCILFLIIYAYTL